MSTPLLVSHTQEPRRLPALRMTMIAGLVGNVLVNAAIMAVIWVVASIIPGLERMPIT